MQKIRPVIEEYVANNSVSMVFNQKNIFIADKKYDITKQIIELIDKKIKKMNSLNKDQIRDLLPHREPMLLIDELNDIKKLPFLATF